MNICLHYKRLPRMCLIYDVLKYSKLDTSTCIWCSETSSAKVTWEYKSHWESKKHFSFHI